MSEAEYKALENREKSYSYCEGRADGHRIAPTYEVPAVGWTTGAFFVDTGLNRVGGGGQPQQAQRQEPQEPVKMRYRMACVDTFAPMMLNMNNVNKLVPTQNWYFDEEKKIFIPQDLWEVHYVMGGHRTDQYSDPDTGADLIKPFNMKELK